MKKAMKKRATKMTAAMLAVVVLLGIMPMQPAGAVTGTLKPYPASGVKVYWTDVVSGKSETTDIARNFYQIGKDGAYCMDYGYKASSKGADYKKIKDELSAANKNRLKTLFLNGYPNKKIEDYSGGFALKSNDHLRIGTQIALWRLMRDIGSPSAKGKKFAFRTKNSYYNAKLSKSKTADNIVAYAEALYEKAKNGSKLVWSRIDSSFAVTRTANSPDLGAVVRSGPYIVRSDNQGAKFVFALYEGGSGSKVLADPKLAVITDRNHKKITSFTRFWEGCPFFVDIKKTAMNSGRKYTMKMRPDPDTYQVDYDIYKCKYPKWQRLISPVRKAVPVVSKTVSAVM